LVCILLQAADLGMRPQPPSESIVSTDTGISADEMLP
jgi:hypothetical protein